MLAKVLWAVAVLLLGIALGWVGGLVRRRPVPEVTTYLAPESASGPTAVGPHRSVLRA